MKLSKEQKAKRTKLEIIHNGIKTDWSRSLIHTWADVAKFIPVNGYPISGIPTYPELKILLETQLKELDETFQKENQSSSNNNATGLSSNQSSEIKALEVSKPTEGVVASPNNQTIEKSESLTNVIDSVYSESALQLNEDNDYGWVRSPNESQDAWVSWYQKKAITQIVYKITVKKYKGILLLAGTGTGKTFILGSVLRRLMDIGHEHGKTLSHIPYLVLSRTTVLEQTGRVFKNNYNIQPSVDVDILNIEQMRSKNGRFWIKKEIEIVDGKETDKFTWKKGLQPCLIEFDESQAAKNSSSSQHKIMCSYSDLPGEHCIVHSSATPFVTVMEAKCFAVSTGIDISKHGFPLGTKLSNENWDKYAKIIAHPSDPNDPNEAAVERLMRDLDDYVVRVKGVKKQFDEINSVERIDFQSEKERTFYFEAWNRFLREKEKYEKGEISEHPFTILLKFSMAAEECRAPLLAKKLYEAYKNGYAAVMACKFKTTIIKVSMELIENYGVKREDISLIWGGGQTQLNKKQLAKKKIRDNAEKLKLAGMDIDQLLQDIDLADVEDKELLNIPESYRLGQQNLKDRQVEIDKFQSGKSNFAMFTFRAGGVGLSLHHTDELTTFKCRRKKSGYAVEEDIPKVPVKPRYVYLAPTYSAIELVQGLGRCPRLTSLSPTIQKVLFYKGTIEDKIAAIVSKKLRCLTKVVGMREKWADVIVGAKTEAEAIETTKDIKDDVAGDLIEDAETTIEEPED